MIAVLDADLALAACMFLAAALYTSVGHAGASAYIALMALWGMSAAVMRPTALVLNLIAASFASLRYWRAGLVRGRVLWPFLVGAVPAAFLGGSIELPSEVYRPLVGAVLLFAAARLLWPAPLAAAIAWRDPAIAAAIACGGAIGLLAGLTGTGGGIFLSPLLLFMAWSAPRPASGVIIVFIMCNSAAGLLGNVASMRALPDGLAVYAGAVFLGSVLGSTLGVRLPWPLLQKALAVVLVVAGVKLIGLG